MLARLGASSLQGAAAGRHLLRCRPSTVYTDIACVAAPCTCKPGARAGADLSIWVRLYLRIANDRL